MMIMMHPLLFGCRGGSPLSHMVGRKFRKILSVMHLVCVPTYRVSTGKRGKVRATSVVDETRLSVNERAMTTYHYYAARPASAFNLIVFIFTDVACCISQACLFCRIPIQKRC